MSEEEKDIKELKAVFDTISSFLKGLAPTIKEILDVVLSTINGSTLGKDAGEFYKGLISAGVDKEKATKMTEEYIKNKMAILQIIPELIKTKKFPNLEVEKEEKKLPKEEESSKEKD